MDVLWPDAELESVSFDYDALRLTLKESTGQTDLQAAAASFTTRRDSAA